MVVRNMDPSKRKRIVSIGKVMAWHIVTYVDGYNTTQTSLVATIENGSHWLVNNTIGGSAVTAPVSDWLGAEMDRAIDKG